MSEAAARLPGIASLGAGPADLWELSGLSGTNLKPQRRGPPRGTVASVLALGTRPGSLHMFGLAHPGRLAGGRGGRGLSGEAADPFRPSTIRPFPRPVGYSLRPAHAEAINPPGATAAVRGCAALNAAAPIGETKRERRSTWQPPIGGIPSPPSWEQRFTTHLATRTRTGLGGGRLPDLLGGIRF